MDIPDLSIYLVPQYLLILFYLNTAWRRIAADIKVKVKTRNSAYRLFKT